ncbi:MAG: hypothetical protein ACRD2R_02915 [Terriglobales bacterium]
MEEENELESTRDALTAARDNQATVVASIRAQRDAAVEELNAIRAQVAELAGLLRDAVQCGPDGLYWPSWEPAVRAALAKVKP